MNIGEIVREVVVEPLLYPAAMPAAPLDPEPTLVPGPEPARVPQ